MREWHRSWRADPIARAIADRHYSRQNPGAAQFVPPGRCLVLLADGSTSTCGALWVTSWPLAEYVSHEWAGAWTCSIFRNEARDVFGLSSDLIASAIAATRAEFGDPPALGMVTFVDRDAVKSERDPGRCFLRAGFEFVGYTKTRGYVALQLTPDRMPAPIACAGTQEALAYG